MNEPRELASSTAPETPGASASHDTRQGPASLRPHLMAEADLAVLAETFRALGDGTRLRILDALSRAELCVCDLAELVGLSASAVSHQLRLLRGLRLVRPRRDGRHVFYTLDDHHVVDLFRQGLAHVGESARVDPRTSRPRAPGGAFPDSRREAARLDDESDGGLEPGRRCE